MYGIKQNKNEWYTGLHYPYNPDQDKTRKEIKRILPSQATLIDEQFTALTGWTASNATLSLSGGNMIVKGVGASFGYGRKNVGIQAGVEYTIKGRIKSINGATLVIGLYQGDAITEIYEKTSPVFDTWYEFEVVKTFAVATDVIFRFDTSGPTSADTLEVDYLTITYMQDNGFVEDDDYDDEGYFTIPTKVRYKQFVDRKTRGQYAQNASNISGFKEIEVSRDYSIRVKDRFQTMDQDEDATPYKVEEIDTKRNTYKTKATLILGGLYDEYNNTKILRLR